MPDSAVDQSCWSEFIAETSDLLHEIPPSKDTATFTTSTTFDNRLSDLSSASASSSSRVGHSERMNDAVPETLPELEFEDASPGRVATVESADPTGRDMLNDAQSPIRSVIKAFQTGSGLSQKIYLTADLSAIDTIDFLRTAESLEAGLYQSEQLIADTYQQCVDELGQQFIDALIADHTSTNRLQALTINLMNQIMDLLESLDSPATFDLGAIPYLKRESERCCHEALDVLGRTRELLAPANLIPRASLAHTVQEPGAELSPPPPIPARSATRRSVNPRLTLQARERSASRPHGMGQGAQLAEHVYSDASSDRSLIPQDQRFSVSSLVPQSLSLSKAEPTKQTSRTATIEPPRQGEPAESKPEAMYPSMTAVEYSPALEESLSDIIDDAVRQAEEDDLRFSFQSHDSVTFNAESQNKELPPLPLPTLNYTRHEDPAGQGITPRKLSTRDSVNGDRDAYKPAKARPRTPRHAQSRNPTPLSLFPQAAPVRGPPPIPIRTRPQTSMDSYSSLNSPPNLTVSTKSSPSTSLSPRSSVMRYRKYSSTRPFHDDQYSTLEVLSPGSPEPGALQRRRTNSSDLGVNLPLSPPMSAGTRSYFEEYMQASPPNASSYGSQLHEHPRRMSSLRHGASEPQIPTSPREPTPASSLNLQDLTMRHDSEYFIMGGFCHGGQMALRGETDHYKVITRPVGLHSSTTAAKCVKCSFELTWQVFEKDLSNPPDRTGIYCTAEPNIRYRASFLSKSHVAGKLFDHGAYGCLFCYEENRTLEEEDATVFYSVAQLMHHLARHARPLPRIPGLKVVYNDSTDIDFDIFFTTMQPTPDPLGESKLKLGSRPKAYAVSDHRAKTAKFQEKDPERQATLQFGAGARIIGITFPSRFNGQWCGGYHDGRKGLFPASMIQLEKPRGEDVVMNGRSTLTATARWDFKSKDSAWLSFSKKEKISCISFAYGDHWCYFGQNSKGKFGLFPSAFIEALVDEGGVANPRSSMGSGSMSGPNDKVGEKISSATKAAFSLNRKSAK